MADDRTTSLVDVFERALKEIQARVFVSAPPVIAVAYSGGLDSSVLLHLASHHARARGMALFAFHIHHGISPNADAWLAHCERECKSAGIAFDARRVSVPARDSVEQAARIQRYAALGEMCIAHKVSLLLTAHHLDDQAETVLLQLLRGSGVAGLCGMEPFNRAPDLLKTGNVLIARPLLGVSRAQLGAFVAGSDIAYINDESNADVRYARNALRHDVIPPLMRHFPGFAERLARSASHAQAAQRLLDQLAAQDLAEYADGGCLSLSALSALDSDRLDNLFRYWFSVHGVRMPSTAWLAEMRQQLACANEDAQVRVTHPDCEIRRYQGRIYMTPRVKDDDVGSDSSITFRWNGEDCIEFATFKGRLLFERDGYGTGVDADWLRTQQLTLHGRRGGERLKAAPGRPTRSLKHHYQALHIPAWGRPFLPLLSTAAGQLVFAAGVGLNWCDLPSGDVILRWERNRE